MTLSEFLASIGKTANDVTVTASTNTPTLVQSVAGIIGTNAQSLTGPTAYAVLLNIGAQDTPLP